MRVAGASIYVQINQRNLNDSRERADQIRDKHDQAVEVAIEQAAAQAEISTGNANAPSTKNGGESENRKQSYHIDKIEHLKLNDIYSGNEIVKAENYRKGFIIDITV